MACFVLVHGSYHGPWCREKVSGRLRAPGHEIVEMDLIVLKRHTLSDDVREVVRAVRRSGGPAVLVGHSSGGHVVSGAAEAAPDDIACLVCVSGVLLPSDRTAGDIPREPHERPAVPRSAEDLPGCWKRSRIDGLHRPGARSGPFSCFRNAVLGGGDRSVGDPFCHGGVIPFIDMRTAG